MARALVLAALAVVLATAYAQSDNKSKVVGLARLETSNHINDWASLGLTLVSAADEAWNAMSTGDFASYRAVTIGDNFCDNTPSDTKTFLITNGKAWGDAIDGNMVIIGTDEDYHRGKHLGAVPLAFMAFVTADAGKVGGYLSLGCMFDGATPGTVVGFLNAAFPAMSKSFTVTGVDCASEIAIVADSPALRGISESHLAGWGCSVHEAFQQWPDELEVLAIAKNIGDSFTSAAGIKGTPYILARGVRAISDVLLEPETQVREPGTAATLKATVTVTGVDLSTTTLTFTAISGPHAGELKSVRMADFASGVVETSYLGDKEGSDIVIAELISASGARIQRSNKITIDWKGIVESGVCGRLGKRNVIVRGTTAEVVGQACECRLSNCFQCRFYFRTSRLIMEATPVCQRCEKGSFRLGAECVTECPPGYTELIKIAGTERPKLADPAEQLRRGRECVRMIAP